MSKRAVVLLSGGVDSTTALAIAVSEGYEIYAMSFLYGQRHEIELERAKEIARHFGARDHAIITVDMRKIGGSALTADIAVPKDRPVDAMQQEIPVTYVPARN